MMTANQKNEMADAQQAMDQGKRSARPCVVS